MNLKISTKALNVDTTIEAGELTRKVYKPVFPSVRTLNLEVTDATNLELLCDYGKVEQLTESTGVVG